MSGAPIKSPWEIINRATIGTPGNNDKILYAPEPGTPFVTQAKAVTIATLATLTGAITTTKVSFSNAQVIAWPTTPLTILAAPPAGQAFVIMQLSMWLNPGLADYTNIDPTAKIIPNYQSGGSPTSALAFGANILSLFLLTAGGLSGALVANPPSINLYQSLNPSGPAALTLTCTNGALGNFTGGNAGNILRVQVWYGTVTI